MNTLLFYGGTALAFLLLGVSVFLLFYFKIPGVIAYFLHFKKTNVALPKSPDGKKRRSSSAAASYGTATELIELEYGGTEMIKALESKNAIEINDAIEYAKTELLEHVSPDQRVIQGVTEILDHTVILPEL